MYLKKYILSSIILFISLIPPSEAVSVAANTRSIEIFYKLYNPQYDLSSQQFDDVIHELEDAKRKGRRYASLTINGILTSDQFHKLTSYCDMVDKFCRLGDKLPLLQEASFDLGTNTVDDIIVFFEQARMNQQRELEIKIISDNFAPILDVLSPYYDSIRSLTLQKVITPIASSSNGRAGRNTVNFGWSDEGVDQLRQTYDNSEKDNR